MTCGMRAKTEAIPKQRFALGIGLIASLLSTISCVDTEEPAEADAGTGADNGATGALVDPCRSMEGLTFDKPILEDFETGIATYWWVDNDGTGHMDLLPGREPQVTEIPGGRCGTSRFALNVTAKDLAVWGGGFGINFFPKPLDLSEWDGVSFWARRGQSSNKTLFFAVSEKHTDESNGAVLFEDQQPYCYEMTDDAKRKCDRFGVGIGLDTEWRFFTIRFDEMRQRGYGQVAPALDRSALIGLNVSFAPGDWDIWMDDVAFFKENGGDMDTEKDAGAGDAGFVTKPTPQGGFVTREGTKLKLNGGDFYFSGANSYSMLYSEADAEEQFEIADEMGLNAIRLWGFWNGEDNEDQIENGKVIRRDTPDTDIYGHYTLQPRAGVFPEAAWGRLDYVVYLANVYNIKLIIPLLNEWLEFGGIETYLTWAGVAVETQEERGEGFHAYDGYLKKEIRSLFWENAGALELYHAYVMQMLNRQNTYTGVLYKNDPAIMIWEIMNEPRYGPWEGDGDKKTKAVKKWLSDAAVFIKDEDPNHLVGTGEEGFLFAADQEGMDLDQDGINDADEDHGHRAAYPWDAAGGEGDSFVLNADIDKVDVLGFHCWPFQWGLWRDSDASTPDNGKDFLGEYPEIWNFPPEWITAHVILAEKAGKPLYLGEFGLQILRREGSNLDHRDAVMQAVYDRARNTNLAGVAYWHMTASHDVDSVTYKGLLTETSRKTLLQARFYDDITPHDNDFRFDIVCDGKEVTGTEDSTCDMIRDYTAFMTGKVTNPDPDFIEPCLPPKTVCGDECVLLDTHPNHCGACTTACKKDQTCKAGTCAALPAAAANAVVDDNGDADCTTSSVGSKRQTSIIAQAIWLLSTLLAHLAVW